MKKKKEIIFHAEIITTSNFLNMTLFLKQMSCGAFWKAVYSQSNLTERHGYAKSGQDDELRPPSCHMT